MPPAAAPRQRRRRAANVASEGGGALPRRQVCALFFVGGARPTPVPAGAAPPTAPPAPPPCRCDRKRAGWRVPPTMAPPCAARHARCWRCRSRGAVHWRWRIGARPRCQVGVPPRLIPLGHRQPHGHRGGPEGAGRSSSLLFPPPLAAPDEAWPRGRGGGPAAPAVLALLPALLPLVAHRACVCGCAAAHLAVGRRVFSGRTAGEWGTGEASCDGGRGRLADLPCWCGARRPAASWGSGWGRWWWYLTWRWGVCC